MQQVLYNCCYYSFPLFSLTLPPHYYIICLLLSLSTLVALITKAATVFSCLFSIFFLLSLFYNLKSLEKLLFHYTHYQPVQSFAFFIWYFCGFLGTFCFIAKAYFIIIYWKLGGPGRVVFGHFQSYSIRYHKE